MPLFHKREEEKEYGHKRATFLSFLTDLAGLQGMFNALDFSVSIPWLILVNNVFSDLLGVSLCVFMSFILQSLVTHTLHSGDLYSTHWEYKHKLTRTLELGQLL